MDMNCLIKINAFLEVLPDDMRSVMYSHSVSVNNTLRDKALAITDKRLEQQRLIRANFVHLCAWDIVKLLSIHIWYIYQSYVLQTISPSMTLAIHLHAHSNLILRPIRWRQTWTYTVLTFGPLWNQVFYFICYKYFAFIKVMKCSK